MSHLSLYVNAPFLRGALPPNHNPEEHFTVASCLREETSVPGLHLSAHLPKRFHTAGKPEGRLPGLWKLDS